MSEAEQKLPGRLSVQQAFDEAGRRWREWAATPEGRAALDAGWEKQKASMRARGLTPGPD